MSLARILIAGCACALSSDLAASQSGPIIEIAQDGSSYRLRVEATFAASPRHVWAVLTNCDRAREFVPHLESCRIIEKDPAGRWDIRENVANPPFLPRIRTIVRNEYAPPRSMTYKLVSGNMRVSEGAWTISATGSGAKVNYVARFAPDMPVPGFLLTGAVKGDLAAMFSRLDSLSLALETEK